MRRDDETTTKKNDTMSAARCDDDRATTQKHDTVKTVRCDEEKTETKTGRGRKFPFTLVRENSSHKMMTGVGRNKSTDHDRSK